MAKTMLRTAAATLGFALLHSLLASRQAKEMAGRLFGQRQRNGLYRPFFLLQSVVSFAALAASVWRLPNRVLYHVEGALTALMRLGQAAGLGLAVYAAYEVGLGRILGLTSFLAWLSKEERVPAEPEAQGPSLDEAGRLHVDGPFRWMRHPLNFAPLLVFWLNPVMTVKLAAFNLAASLYLVLGSVHEEVRLRAAYGKEYEYYERSGVPFYLPIAVKGFSEESG